MALESQSQEVAPRMVEELGNIVARHERSVVYDILSRKRGFQRVLLKEAFDQAKEHIESIFPEYAPPDRKKKLYRLYFINATALTIGTNLALVSTGQELWLTYTHLIEFEEEYLNTFPKEKSSNAGLLRAASRNELRTSLDVSRSRLRQVARKNNLVARIQALATVKAQFVAMSRQDDIFFTLLNRIHW